jgi:hypothetical protein
VAADAGRTDDPRRTVGPYTISFTTPGESAVCRPEETVLSAILRSGATDVFSDLTIQLTAANRYRRLRAWSHVGSGASFPSGT